MKQGKVYIGTSGFAYSHWRGKFYPEDLSTYKWFEYYTKHFDTVELNVTFYRLPQKSAFQSWYRRSPDDFVFVIKGSRYITHVRKLNNVVRPTKEFFNRAKYLKEKLGVILWQFQGNWRINLSRLEKFLKILQRYPYRHVFEFRHESWFCKRIYKLLKKYKMGLVISDSPRYPKTEEITADFVYIRFHGGKVLYGSKYSERELKEWAKKIKKWQKQGLNVYAYFNNDWNAYAIKNAKQLIKILR